MTALLEVSGVSKSYGHIQALEDVSFACEGGQIVGLLGDNGAGKSTLVKILSGVIRSDSGHMAIDGERIDVESPAEARERGIETVHQTLALCPNLDVAANLYLNREIRHPNPVLARLGWLDDKAMRQGAVRILERLRIRMPSVRQDVLMLSGGQRQAIAVGRAVGWGKRVVLMDEPAAALGVEQTALVLALMQELRRQGVLILFITHNMEEVMDVCDRAVVLRQGRVVADLTISDVTRRDLVDHITGAI